jgi:hypothetical protein
MHARIDHVHHLRVHLFLHASLLLLEFARPVLQLANINLAKIILRSRLAKQTVRAHPLSTETELNGQFPHSLALLRDPLVLLLEVRRSGDVAGLFLRERLQVVLELLDRNFRVGAACFLALITSSRSCSSVSKRVSVARSSCRRRSASPCSSCRHSDLRAQGQRGFPGQEGMCTHLALCDLVRERFELLAHIVDPGRGIG